MATCRDCEYFLLAKGFKDKDGQRNAFCPVRRVNVKALDTACLKFCNAYEGVFARLPGND